MTRKKSVGKKVMVLFLMHYFGKGSDFEEKPP